MSRSGQRIASRFQFRVARAITVITSQQLKQLQAVIAMGWLVCKDGTLVAIPNLNSGK
jgi:hypothetical protein